MTSPDRFCFLASFLAGRTVGVTEAGSGEAAYTDGRYVFVSRGCSVSEQRREVMVQSALLGAGSLDQSCVKALRGRPQVARRYLALEGHRALTKLAIKAPLVATLCAEEKPATATAEESLQVARGRKTIADAPGWFGVIRPSRLLASAAGPSMQPTRKDLHLDFDPTAMPETENDGDEEQGEESKIAKLFENPLFNSSTLEDYFHKVFGRSRSPGEGAPGGSGQVRTVRQVNAVGPNARPMAVPIRFTNSNSPGAVAGVGGALYPEWDVHNKQYRPEWCRVINFPVTSTPDIAAAGIQRDQVLHRRLARLGLGPKVLRGRPDGDELDLEALIGLSIDLKAGYSSSENIYLERRKLARNLGVLILLDASGSVTDRDREGLSVHDHQRRAAATLAMTLEELGDRVAVYGFRSHGRANVHLLALKPFSQRFGAGGRARLNRLEPDGYTRLGAGIRGAGEILKVEAGTPNRLLLLLSDGFPYESGYEAQYAEADVRRALEELRRDGVACLCLSISAATAPDALQRVFGSSVSANASTLAELSPRMDELFLAALKELAAPNPQGSRQSR